MICQFMIYAWPLQFLIQNIVGLGNLKVEGTSEKLRVIQNIENLKNTITNLTH